MTHNDRQTRLITAKRPSLAERICLYIYSSDIPQLAILDETFLSEIFKTPREKLCKRFEKKMKKSLDTFINEQRLLQIKISIFNHRYTPNDLPELSRQFGFHSYQDFSRRFSKWLGITPQRFIEIVKEKHKERRKEINLLCMFLNSWEEDSKRKPGNTVLKVWYTYHYEVVKSLEKENLIRRYDKTFDLTDAGEKKIAELIKKYFNEETNV